MHGGVSEESMLKIIIGDLHGQLGINVKSQSQTVPKALKINLAVK